MADSLAEKQNRSFQNFHFVHVLDATRYLNPLFSANALMIENKGFAKKQKPDFNQFGNNIINQLADSLFQHQKKLEAIAILPICFSIRFKVSNTEINLDSLGDLDYI